VKVKKIATVLVMSVVAFASQASASSCGTDKLCVPGDFPSPNGADFNMNLLGGDIYFDIPIIQPSGIGTAIGGGPLDNLQPIRFHASPFTDPTAGSVGTSTLTYSNIAHYSLGSIDFFGFTTEFYLQGTGLGSLVDIDGTKGDWSLNVPLFATWNNIQFNFGNVQLSTANTLTYNAVSNTLSSLSGQSMNYATGDAFLVGQTTISDPSNSNPLNGLRITLGLNGNDPVVSVPEAAVVWQLLAGLGLLGVFVRIRNRSSRPDSLPKAAA
jgi:hypothetical protein